MFSSFVQMRTKMETDRTQVKKTINDNKNDTREKAARRGWRFSKCLGSCFDSSQVKVLTFF